MLVFILQLKKFPLKLCNFKLKIQNYNLKIGTYNARTLSSDSRIVELEHELSRIKFDVIGICETRIKGEGCTTLSNSGHNLYYKGGDTCHRGVGFVVHRKIAGNITSFTAKSDRVAKITLKINCRYHLDIIQAYLPTTSHTDEEVEEIYEELDDLITSSKAHYKIIMGDFNAKVGMGLPEESSTRQYGLGERNSRGECLVNFSERHNLKIMNTFFKKKLHRRWTWISPNSTTKNEIDYILTNRPQTFKDVSVINSFNTGSDHRLVRASLLINTKFERSKLTNRPKKPDHRALSARAVEFQLELANQFNILETMPQEDNLDTFCNSISTTIMETALTTAGQDKPPKPDKLSAETKQLREKRRQMKRGGTNIQNIEYSEICKAIRSRMEREIQAYDEKEQLRAILNNKGLKTIKRRQCLGKNNMTVLKEEDGTLINDFNRLIKRCEEFYTELYNTRRPQDQPSTDLETDIVPPPPILISEVESAIKKLSRGKAPGEDGVTAGILKDGGQPIVDILTKLYNRCLSEGQVPSTWKNASVIILHKKGDKTDIKNYRPISLLPVIYKVFSKIILGRMRNTLDERLSREQAGFRPGYSTIDHIQVVSQLQEKANEYNIPLCFAFIDYEKAFDSIEFVPLFSALENQGVDKAYVNIIRNLYNGATATLKLDRESDKIDLKRGARQGDIISPKLFTSCLQDKIIDKINWEERGINIDGELLAHLEFADDIIVIAHTPEELQKTLQDLNDSSQPVGLKMHLGKTKVMFNKNTTKDQIKVSGKKIEEVENYIYLGKMVTSNGDIMPEIKRRITLGWAAFSKVYDLMRSKKTSIEIKRRIFNEYILPVMTYGSETWSLSEIATNKLAVAQRKMERIMLGITLKDKKRNTWIRQQTGVTDIVTTIRSSKHRWAGHVARFQDNRWTLRVTEWTPRQWKRTRGRPKIRWRDDLLNYMGPKWPEKARDRKQWKSSREGFLHHERKSP